jgi:hypothetical protein
LKFTFADLIEYGVCETFVPFNAFAFNSNVKGLMNNSINFKKF